MDTLISILNRNDDIDDLQAQGTDINKMIIRLTNLGTKSITMKLSRINVND